jgi:hypothetical protein
VEFVGGLMTAVFALVYLLRTSVAMTGWHLHPRIFGIGINKAFKPFRPIFRARPKITAEVTPPDRVARRRACRQGLSPGAKSEFSPAACSACSECPENADGDFTVEPFRRGADGAVSA